MKVLLAIQNLSDASLSECIPCTDLRTAWEFVTADVKTASAPVMVRKSYHALYRACLKYESVLVAQTEAARYVIENIER